MDARASLVWIVQASIFAATGAALKEAVIQLVPGAAATFKLTLWMSRFPKVLAFTIVLEIIRYIFLVYRRLLAAHKGTHDVILTWRVIFLACLPGKCDTTTPDQDGAPSQSENYVPNPNGTMRHTAKTRLQQFYIWIATFFESMSDRIKRWISSEIREQVILENKGNRNEDVPQAPNSRNLFTLLYGLRHVLESCTNIDFDDIVYFPLFSQSLGYILLVTQFGLLLFFQAPQIFKAALVLLVDEQVEESSYIIGIEIALFTLARSWWSLCTAQWFQRSPACVGQPVWIASAIASYFRFGDASNGTKQHNKVPKLAGGYQVTISRSTDSAPYRICIKMPHKEFACPAESPFSAGINVVLSGNREYTVTDINSEGDKSLVLSVAPEISDDDLNSTTMAIAVSKSQYTMAFVLVLLYTLAMGILPWWFERSGHIITQTLLYVFVFGIYTDANLRHQGSLSRNVGEAITLYYLVTGDTHMAFVTWILYLVCVWRDARDQRRLIYVFGFGVVGIVLWILSDHVSLGILLIVLGQLSRVADCGHYEVAVFFQILAFIAQLAAFPRESGDPEACCDLEVLVCLLSYLGISTNMLYTVPPKSIVLDGFSKYQKRTVTVHAGLTIFLVVTSWFLGAPSHLRWAMCWQCLVILLDIFAFDYRVWIVTLSTACALICAFVTCHVFSLWDVFYWMKCHCLVLQAVILLVCSYVYNEDFNEWRLNARKEGDEPATEVPSVAPGEQYENRTRHKSPSRVVFDLALLFHVAYLEGIAFPDLRLLVLTLYFIFGISDGREEIVRLLMGALTALSILFLGDLAALTAFCATVTTLTIVSTVIFDSPFLILLAGNQSATQTVRADEKNTEGTTKPDEEGRTAKTPSTNKKNTDDGTDKKELNHTGKSRNAIKKKGSLVIFATLFIAASIALDIKPSSEPSQRNQQRTSPNLDTDSTEENIPFRIEKPPCARHIVRSYTRCHIELSLIIQPQFMNETHCCVNINYNTAYVICIEHTDSWTLHCETYSLGTSLTSLLNASAMHRSDVSAGSSGFLREFPRHMHADCFKWTIRM